MKTEKNRIMPSRVIAAVFAIGLMMWLTAIPVTAQEEKAPEKQERQELELGAITVSAEKREENIQEVPMSISAFSETSLEDAGVDEIRDVTVMVPNLDLMNYSARGYQVNFRGMNYSIFTRKLPLVMYVDNVPYDDGNNFFEDLNNVERVEVLRGANGTLYGQNALAGIINIVSKVPGNEPGGKATVTLGQYETYGANAYYNGPLVEDKLFFGFSGSYDETAGFMENDYPGEDTFGGDKTTRGKGRMRWKASDHLTADLILSVYQYRAKGGVGNVIGGTEWTDHEYRNPDDVHDVDSSQISLDLTYETGAFDIKSITTSRSIDNEWVGYWQFSNAYIGRLSEVTETETMTQEFRLQSKKDSVGLKWMAGLFFMNDKKEWTESGMEYVYNAYGISGASYNYCNWPSTITANSQSIFSQVTVPLVEKMELTAGARYEIIEKTLDYVYEIKDTYGSSGSSFDGPGLMPTTTYSTTSDWDAFLPRAVLSYQVNPEDMVFFSYSQGYLPGGFNRTESNKNKADFDAQYSTTYELGTKTAWMNNSLTFNASVFHINITDLQVYEWLSMNEYYASNAGKARSQGAEVELAVRPMAGLELATAIGVLDTEFVEYEGYEGNKVADSPDFTAHFSAKYRHGSGIYFGGSIQGHGDAWADDANTVKKDGYWIANTRIGYEKSNWDVYLNVENLTDTEYLEHVIASSNMPYSTVGEPRTFSITASTRF